MELYESLLESYKNFDNINNDRVVIKIFVSYIHRSFLFKSKILTPVHLGRAIETRPAKGITISNADIEWLHKNCIGDDIGDNISETNRRIGFFTGTYWAWKNYEKIGNPEYFGSFGFRRLLSCDFLENLTQYDCIFPYMIDMTNSGGTIKDHIIKLHGLNMYQIMVDIFKNNHPNDFYNFEKYLQLNRAYWYEIYIMKKQIFFDFCNFIYPILLDCFNIASYKYVTHSNTLEMDYMRQIGEMRDVAYIAEVVTGYYCYQLQDKYIVKHQKIKYFIEQKVPQTMIKFLKRKHYSKRNEKKESD